MVDVQEDIIAVLDKAQTSTVTHAKLIKTLRPLHDQTDLYEFLEAFVTPLRAALVVVRKEPAVERVLDFAAKFAASVAPLESTAASGEEEEDAAGDEDGEEDKDEEATEDRGESDGGSEDRYTETEEEEEEKEELDENFFNFLLLKVLSFHGASGRAVRFRSCQLVAKMVKCAVERGCWLQSSVLEAVRDVMMERIRDKIPVVRVHAVQALELLQEDVSLQEELARLLERDPSPDVRRATLNTIVITDHTLPAIISRTRDVKEQIRKDAFWMLAEKCNIRNFRIEQRIKLLSDGLNDRSEIVREACVKGLLHSWSSNLNGDLLALLSKLDVESSSEVAEQALCRLLEEIDVGLVVQSTVELMDPANRLESWDDEDEERVEMTVTERVLPYDLLHSAEAFYWSCVCRYLHKMGDEGDQLMEKVLPTLSDFCVYVQQYVERELLPAKDVEEEMQKQFVCVQLLSVFSVMDLSDEVGRQRLGKMVLDLLILPGLPLALVSPLLSQQTTLWPQPHTRVEKLLEVIADLQQPSLSATLSSGGGVAPSSSSQSTSVDESQMNALSNLSLLDTHSDPDILARCLMIATEMLKEQRLRKLPVNLKTMVDVLVLPSIQSELPDIRDLAFCCLGLACLHDVSLARNHLLLFLQVSQVDHESVQATAVKVVFDLLLLFGFEAFSLTCPGSSSKTKTPDTQDQADETLVADGEGKEVEGGEAGKEGAGEEGAGEEGAEEGAGEEGAGENGETKKITQKILATMADFLDGESPVLREISGEGLAKLLLSRRVISQKLLARLLVLWVDPSTDEEARLRAVLGIFFPAFASSDRSCRGMVGEVFLPVLEAISEAPAESPLRGIDLDQLADYLVHLCAPQEPNEDSVHDSLAISVANAVLSEPENSVLTRVYCRSLTHMQLSSSNKAELLILMEQIERNVGDKRSLNYIKKVVRSLRSSEGGGEGGGGEEKGEGDEGEEVEEAGNEVEGEGDREADDATADGKLEEKEEEEEREEVGDDTIVAPATTPPRRASPAQQTATRSKSKSVVQKSTRKAKASSKKTVKKRRKRTTFLDSSDEDGSDSCGDVEIPPQQLSSLPSRVRSCRIAKMSARKRISEFSGVTPRGRKGKEETAEESDDSLIGEHSPFVRQPVKRTGGGGGIPMLNYDDDDAD